MSDSSAAKIAKCVKQYFCSNLHGEENLNIAMGFTEFSIWMTAEKRAAPGESKDKIEKKENPKENIDGGKSAHGHCIWSNGRFLLF